MWGTVAVTDYGWYKFLLRAAPEEVNFWTPSDRRAFHGDPSSPFFFKLKAPHKAICGYGLFARWASLPDWLAWECFGTGNGCASLAELRARIGAIRGRIGYVPGAGVDNIGCILLVQAVFFPPDRWITQPSDWPPRTVTSKAYDLTRDEGARIWREALERSAAPTAVAGASPVVGGPPAPRYGTARTVTPRLGQGTFRVAVLDAYGRACAATGEHSLPALDAAHIQAYEHEGPHDVRNGLLLRADLHRLFDKGYVTVTPELHLEVSNRLKADYHNGRSYYPLHGTQLRLPEQAQDRPAAEFLRWHNDRVFLG